VTRKHAAELLGVSPATIDRWVAVGELKAIRRRGYTRIYREAIADFESRHLTKPEQPAPQIDLAARTAKPPRELIPRSATEIVVATRDKERRSKR
jgi:excisionase family DNA binding protein